MESKLMQTTGEIVWELRSHKSAFNTIAADSLESKEQENLDLRESVKNYIALTEDLREQKAIETARAEQAGNANEWRYALMKLINENPEIKCTSICDGECLDCATSASGTARGFRLKKNLRGQPQDGEGL